MESTGAVSDAARGHNWLAVVKSKKAVVLTVLAVALTALIPLYGVLFPPLVDLPEHILISKLLWEKLSGTTRLDLEVSFFLGYRLFPAFMLVVISLCKLGGISFVYLPKIVATALLSFHAVVIATVLGSFLKDKSWKSHAYAVCFSLPAVACMYSACWFIGFVNYTLAITLLIPAMFLTERFLRSGKLVDASLLFVSLLLVYTAHPFGPTFWLVWCFSRSLAALAARSFVLEWKRLILLGIIFSPIFLYHFLATTGTSLAPSSQALFSQSPFLSMNDWYHFRLRGLLDGVFLGADNASVSKLFGRAALGLMLVSTILAFCSGNQRAKNLSLTSVLAIFIASWVNEKFIPVPGGHWLAYDYRFGSTSYVMCLAGVGMALIHSLPVPTDRVWYKVVFGLLASVAVVSSADHLLEVRKAYTRFDVPARKYMAKLLNHEKPTGISLPRGRYHPDGTYLNNYICLTQPDCNAPGTYFSTGRGSELYPVRLTSPRRLVRGPLVGYWKMDEPSRSDMCFDSSGNRNAGTPTGTTVIEGRVGRARSFSGQDDYITVPTINISKEITVAAWVYSDNFAQNGFIVTKNPVNTQWALFLESDGLVKWRGSGIEKKVECAAPSNKAWHHIAAKQKGTSGSLYVDGILRASGPVAPIGNAPSSISIGRFDTTGFNYFVGRIDEVRIYDRALSDAEISELYASVDSKSPSSP